MNSCENANETPRLDGRAYFLLLLVCISVSGCAIASETGRVFYLAKRTTHIEPKFYRYIRSDRLAQREARKLAEQAFAEYAGSSSRADLSRDFENGFVEGFADYLYRGGSGQPPAIPPRGYWNMRFLNQFGKVSINDWYDGFRQGAQDCKARGLRDMWVVPTSLYAKEAEEGSAATSAVKQPDEPATDVPDEPLPAAEATATPALPEPEDVGDSGSVESDAEAADEAELDPGWLDEELEPPQPEPPQIDDGEESLIDDSLSIRQVAPATTIPTHSSPKGLEENRWPVSVAQASNQVEVASPGEPTETKSFEREFRKNMLRQSNTNGNRLRAPADPTASEPLRIVFEPNSAPVAVEDELNDAQTLPLKVGAKRKNLPDLSAPRNWHEEGRSRELPLRITSARNAASPTQNHPSATTSPEDRFAELEMLLKSDGDTDQLPRIIHKLDREDGSDKDREGTNAIRWRIRD